MLATLGRGAVDFEDRRNRFNTVCGEHPSRAAVAANVNPSSTYKVTGELRFSDPGGEVVGAVECADTDTDGAVVLGGTVTESTDDEISGLVALFIRDGDPDSVAVWLDDGENESCSDLLANRGDVFDDESVFVDVESDSDSETGRV